ncbi:MAG: hypothetical protein AAGI52_17330 [Bacteroidota bacterium]
MNINFDFYEAIIEDIKIDNYGTIITLDIVSSPILEGRCVIECRGVISFEMHNDINNEMMENIGNINWGFWEIADVKITMTHDRFETRVFWENDTNIFITSNNINIRVID